MLQLFPGAARPLVFAHRGISSLYPENTLASFIAAKDAGVHGIELDVHLTKDGKLAVIHDDTTARVSPRPDGGFLRIEESLYEDLKKVDVGSWKGDRFSAERIPLLEDVFEAVGGGIFFDIEIKSRTPGDRGLESLLAAALAKSGTEGNCIVSSFNPFALRRFKRLCPRIPTAIIWTDSSELHWFLRKGEGRWIGGVDVLKPAQHLVAGLRGCVRDRLPVLPWTVDSAGTAAEMISLGCDGVISNCPQDLGIRLGR